VFLAKTGRSLEGAAQQSGADGEQDSSGQPREQSSEPARA
jgi:hypothetical protein